MENISVSLQLLSLSLGTMRLDELFTRLCVQIIIITSSSPRPICHSLFRFSKCLFSQQATAPTKKVKNNLHIFGFDEMMWGYAGKGNILVSVFIVNYCAYIFICVRSPLFTLRARPCQNEVIIVVSQQERERTTLRHSSTSFAAAIINISLICSMTTITEMKSTWYHRESLMPIGNISGFFFCCHIDDLVLSIQINWQVHWEVGEFVEHTLEWSDWKHPKRTIVGWCAR